MTGKIIKLKEVVKNFFDKENEVIYVTGTPDWIIKNIGSSLESSFKKNKLIKLKTNISFRGYRKKIIHFGFLGSLIDNRNEIRKIHKSNKIILSWYHIAPGDERIKLIPELNERVLLFHTICNKTKRDLIKLGASPEKVKVIHSGLDLNRFRMKNEDDKLKIKKILGLPNDKKIIGSFQKDGVGWGEGNEPKLVKGPDVFCDAIEKIAKKYPIHVLLTGPSRGYVKNRLEKAGIAYTHKYFKNYFDIVDFFNVLDLYIISSRVEGGPNAILETWATGVPLVSTEVGMIPDLVNNNKNGFMVDIEDVEKIVEKSLEIFNNEELRGEFVKNGLEEVKKYDWDIISEKHYELMYKDL